MIELIKAYGTCAIVEESVLIDLAQYSLWPDLIERPYVEKLIVVQPQRVELEKSLEVSVFAHYLMRY